MSGSGDPLFWTPERLGRPSAWWGHVPFAFWLTAQCKPRLLVELGTHHGVSYAAFCEAVLRLNLATRCFAVDTWRGDAQAGRYGEDVYVDLAEFHDRRYGVFSQLLRRTFDEASGEFADATIDLLHIDGCHTYEAVRHDFDTWRPKLSSRAVVLFHDTNERRGDFGVWRLFDELKRGAPSFEFLHCHGLGVLTLGADAPEAIRALCALSGDDEITAVRERFSQLGARWMELASAQNENASSAERERKLQEAVAERDAQIVRSQNELAHVNECASGQAERIKELEAIVARQSAHVREAERDLAELGAQVEELAERALRLEGASQQRIAELEATVADKSADVDRVKRDLAESQMRFEEANRQATERHHALANAMRPREDQTRLLAALKRPEYDGRLPAKLTGLKSWKPGRRREFRRLAREYRLIAASPLFEPVWYLANNPDVSELGIDPIYHYLRYGAAEGRAPGPSFSGQAYKHANPDVAVAGENPLVHFLRIGAREGRSPGPAWRDDRAHLDGGIETESVGSEYVPLFNGSAANSPRAKLICFYLPQFHAIPENNAWWGEGFTEWTNVRAGQPKFDGHYQPRVPDELGYYNLLDPEVQRRQVELAKLYGVYGFCFYFYWFGGKRLLEAPIDNYFNDKTLDLPFCLCWANENWTRRWDGLDSEILISQQHSPDDDIHFIQAVTRYMLDSRYIRVNGKPLLVVYRPAQLPSAKETVKRWRSWCRSNGFGEIYLAYTQSFEKSDPAEYDFDAAIEFPPNATAVPKITKQLIARTKENRCAIYDWRDLAYQSDNYGRPPYTLFRGVCPSWDNTARRKNSGTIFANSSPALYQRWLTNAIDDTHRRGLAPDEQLIFVNAWNEWAEGAYLEPDARYGYAYLQATRNAVCADERKNGEAILLVTHDCHPHGAQYLILEIGKQLRLDGFDVAILALDGGQFQKDFARIGRTINAKEAGAAAVQTFLASLWAAGARDAITSTVVSGSIVPQLKEVGFRVLSLIHELPGVIRDMRQEANAATIANLADKVVFPSEFVHQRFVEVAPVSADKVVVRQQGLLRKNPYKNRNAEAYRIVCEKHALPADTQIVLSVAFADLRKGPDFFVEAAALVLSERPNATFIWVGNAPREMEEKLASRVQELGLQERVRFIGFDGAPMAYYAAASVYALPSREDPFPNVVLESAEVGVPIVAFEGATGAGEFILDQGGRLAANLDVADFARKISELLVSPLNKPKNAVPTLQRYTLDLLHHLNAYPRVSVVVPNYNYERHIVRRLDSIFQQTFPVYEVIVLDDASSDKSVEVIKAYFECTARDGHLIVNERNSGSVFRQWRKGAACCTGDVIWIAEADDLADSAFLRQLAPSFGNPDIVLAFCQSKQIDENGKVLALNYLEYTKDISDRWRASYLADGRKEIGESLTVKNVIPNVSGVLFRRNALENAIAEIGEDLFRYRIAGDWLVYLYVLLQGKMYYNKNPLNLHRRHPQSVTKALNASDHVREVRELQEIARSLSAPPGETLDAANAYIEHLHEHFGISANR
jgi:glycosyltransferase involved in cell wall biosynthesis